MTDELFKVVFRGEVAAGEDPGSVRDRLAERFRMSPERADALFSGKPVVVKRGIDETTARRLARAFGEAGAICEVRGPAGDAAASGPATADETPPPAAPGHEPAPRPERPAAAAPPATDDDPNQTIVHLPVPDDVSHLGLAEAERYEPPDSGEPPPVIDTSGLEVVADENPLAPPDDSGEPPEIDTSGLALHPDDVPAGRDRS